ncbi:hypothetical protein [Hydrogenophaga crassostreae]|uniref:hypothetical protein n=1 Tax=Hydrogenophaga crassostreae TaxID=1763535 RepID=UPI0012FBF673|nr:hypothetical protein [Hydrogenophaga crassostreae]
MAHRTPPGRWSGEGLACWVLQTMAPEARAWGIERAYLKVHGRGASGLALFPRMGWGTA